MKRASISWLLSVWFFCSEARAQSAESASRSLLLDQAARAAGEGNHERALDLGLRAAAIEQTTSLRMFLGQELLAVHRYAEALDMTQRCAREADSTPTLRNRDTILTRCRAMVIDARAHVGHVIINIPASPPAGFEVRVNGRLVPSVLYGVPYVADAGSVVIRAEALEHNEFSQSIQLAAGATETVAVSLSPRARPGVSWAGPAVLFSLGAVGLGVGAAVGAMALGVDGELASQFGCVRGDGQQTGDFVCPPAQETAVTARLSAASTEVAVSTTGLVLGSALVVGGAVWLGVSLANRTPARVSVVPQLQGGALRIAF